MSETLVSSATPAQVSTLTGQAALRIWNRTAHGVRFYRDLAKAGDADAWPHFESCLEDLRALKALLFDAITTHTPEMEQIATAFAELERDFFTLTPPVPWPDNEPGDQAVS